MQRLWPQPGAAIDAEEAYSSDIRLPAGRPFVRVNMISTIDGAVAFGGRVGAIGGPADKRLFILLRALADTVMVGAGTARAEKYRKVRLPSEAREARLARGQAPLPFVTVVSASGLLDQDSPLLAGDGPPTVVLTGTSVGAGGGDPGVSPGTGGPGQGPVDLQAALAGLHRQGVRHILCEGGPGLNTSLAAVGLVDEVCLTLSPKLAGSVGGALVGGWLGSGSEWLARVAPDAAGQPIGPQGEPPLAQLIELQMHQVLEEDGFLFLRLQRRL